MTFSLSAFSPVHPRASAAKQIHLHQREVTKMMSRSKIDIDSFDTLARFNHTNAFFEAGRKWWLPSGLILFVRFVTRLHVDFATDFSTDS